MMFLLTVWCPDCCGEDFQGCFDGGSEDETFQTLDEARTSAEQWTSRTIYDYRILESRPDGDWTLIEQTAEVMDGKRIVPPTPAPSAQER